MPPQWTSRLYESLDTVSVSFPSTASFFPSPKHAIPAADDWQLRLKARASRSAGRGVDGTRMGTKEDTNHDSSRLEHARGEPRRCQRIQMGEEATVFSPTARVSAIHPFLHLVLVLIMWDFFSLISPEGNPQIILNNDNNNTRSYRIRD